MHVVCQEDVAPLWWDSRLYAAHGEAGLCQSTYWARVIQKLDGAAPLFLEIRDDDARTHALLLAFKKVPWDRKTMQRKKSMKELLFGRNPAWIEWIDGPVLLPDSSEDIVHVLEILVQWLKVFAGREKIRLLRSPGFARTSRWASALPVKAFYTGSNFVVTSWATFLVNLSGTCEELWKRISHSARKAVKKAHNQGLKIRKISSREEFAGCYYNSYVRFEEAAGRSAHPVESAMVARDEDTEGYYSYYVAESREGVVLATLAMYCFNGVATEITSALSPVAALQGIPAQDLLHWELLCEAQRAGCHLFDLAGVSPHPEDKKARGIFRFKEKWGGDYRLYWQVRNENPF